MNEEQNNAFLTSNPPLQEQEIKNQMIFTTSGSSLKKKINPLIIASIILSLLLILVLIGYFIIYPFIVRTYFQDPKKVFENTIQYIAEEINTNAIEKHNKELWNISLQFDTDIKEFQEYTGFTYSARLGRDLEKQNMEIGYGIENKENKYTQNIYKKENKYYSKFSNNPDNLFFLEETKTIEELFSSLTDIINEKDKLTKENISYITNFFSNQLISSIEEDKLTKEEMNITINGKAKKVTRNLYTMQEETRKNTKNKICNAMLEDEKLLSILSDIKKQDIETLKEQIRQAKEEQNEKETIFISIYTYGNKNDIIGVSLEIENKTNLHYYKDKENFEIVLSEENKIVSIIGTKKKDTTEVVISIDEKDILLLSIREWNKEKIDFDYTIFATDTKNLKDNITGTLVYTKEKSTNKDTYSLNLRINVEENFISVKTDITCDWSIEISNINSSVAKGINASTYQEMQNELMNHLIKETPLQIFFSTLSNSFDSDIIDYYNKENNNIELN